MNGQNDTVVRLITFSLEDGTVGGKVVEAVGKFDPDRKERLLFPVEPRNQSVFDVIKSMERYCDLVGFVYRQQQDLGTLNENPFDPYKSNQVIAQ
jgi:hypothetical protein